jgi:hypothetical protein
MELVIIEIGSPEWEYAWNWLSAHPLNSGLEEPSVASHSESGEAWQYMGSFKQGNRVIHEFRHRQHPVTQRREDLKVQASGELTPEQIKKSFKI